MVADIAISVRQLRHIAPDWYRPSFSNISRVQGSVKDTTETLASVGQMWVALLTPYSLDGATVIRRYVHWDIREGVERMTRLSPDTVGLIQGGAKLVFCFYC